MDKIIANNSLPQSDYWNLITSTISSYEIKVVSSDGTVKRRLVKDNSFLVNDVWNVKDIGQIPNFKEQFNRCKSSKKNVKFLTDNKTIGLELKFVFYNKLFIDELSLNSFLSNSTDLNRLVLFLNEKHPHLHSLLKVDVEKIEKQWIWWLNNKGIKTIQRTKNLQYGEYKSKTVTANFFRLMYEKLLNLTDTREEWEKDRWDVRMLKANYGVDYNPSTAQYYIDFTKIENGIFRKYLKNM